MKRNANDTFARGNEGGPGRPKRQTEREYLRAMVGVVALDDWAEIAKRARDDAKAGDAKARAWLARYLVGEPPGNALHSILVDDLTGRDPVRWTVECQLTTPGLYSVLDTLDGDEAKAAVEQAMARLAE